MKKEDIFILILFLCLLLAAILTFIFRGENSKHGYGAGLRQQQSPVLQTQAGSVVRQTGQDYPRWPISKS